MAPNLIALAVPLFLAAIAAEILIDRRRRAGRYRFSSALADLDTGIASQVVDVFLKGIGVWIYAIVYRHRLFELASPWSFLIGLVGLDFVYYWWHRSSHVVNVLWAVHAVHHQSEDFNLAVALRQPAFEALTIIPFHLPLALLGVSPVIYVSSYAIDLIYQFWIHTELIGPLPPVERVFNTPSLHRVHHGVNERYLDRNYGGIFAIWDRFFGTFEPESERPIYGVTHPLGSYNPVLANIVPFQQIGALAAAARDPVDKVRVFFAHPAFRPASLAPPAPASPVAARAKYDPRPPRAVARYVAAHFVLLALASGAFMSFAEHARLADLVLPGLLIIASTLALGAWSEQKPWASTLDLVRQSGALTLLALYLTTLLSLSSAVAVTVAAAVGLALLFAICRPASR